MKDGIPDAELLVTVEKLLYPVPVPQIPVPVPNVPEEKLPAP